MSDKYYGVRIELHEIEGNLSTPSSAVILQHLTYAEALALFSRIARELNELGRDAGAQQSTTISLPSVHRK